VVAFYCYQLHCYLTKTCSKPPPISAETMTSVLQIAVYLLMASVYLSLLSDKQHEIHCIRLLRHTLSSRPPGLQGSSNNLCYSLIKTFQKFCRVCFTGVLIEVTMLQSFMTSHPKQWICPPGFKIHRYSLFLHVTKHNYHTIRAT
jgi:hypothetical protein